jgi:hypothetical protein
MIKDVGVEKVGDCQVALRIFPRPTILRVGVSGDNSGRAEHEDDRKSRGPGLTKAQNPIQIVVLIAVSISTVWTLYIDGEVTSSRGRTCRSRRLSPVRCLNTRLSARVDRHCADRSRNTAPIPREFCLAHFSIQDCHGEKRKGSRLLKSRMPLRGLCS